MRKALGIISIAALAAGIQVAGAQNASQSQSQTQSQTQSSAKPSTPKSQAQKESVADAARKAQEEKKNAPKAPVVFTNDNIGGAGGTINVVGNASAPSKSGGSATAGSDSSEAAAGAAGASSENDEATWRSKFADARKKLEQDKEDLAVMQRELSQLQVQYYPDPQKALKQSVSGADVAKKQQDIAKKQKEIQADQQALSNLQDQLRKAGGDASWARE